MACKKKDALGWTMSGELCDIILDKGKIVIIMAKKCYFLHEQVLYVFHEKIYIPTIENCHFLLLVSVFFVQLDLVKLEMIFSMVIHQENILS